MACVLCHGAVQAGLSLILYSHPQAQPKTTNTVLPHDYVNHHPPRCNAASPLPHWVDAQWASPIEVATWRTYSHSMHDSGGVMILQYSSDGVTWENHSTMDADTYFAANPGYGWSATADVVLAGRIFANASAF